MSASLETYRPEPPTNRAEGFEDAREQYARYLLGRVGVISVSHEIVNIARRSGPAEATRRYCQKIGYTYEKLSECLPFLLTQPRESALVLERALQAQERVGLDPAAAQALSGMQCPAATEHFEKKIVAMEAILMYMGSLGSGLQRHLQAERWKAILRKSWAVIQLSKMATLRKHIFHLQTWQMLGDEIVASANQCLVENEDDAAFVRWWTGGQSQRVAWPRVAPSRRALAHLSLLANMCGNEAELLKEEARYFEERSFRAVRPAVPLWL